MLIYNPQPDPKTMKPPTPQKFLAPIPLSTMSHTERCNVFAAEIKRRCALSGASVMPSKDNQTPRP